MENTEFTGNFLDAEGRKFVPNLFKAFLLVEHKMSSSESLRILYIFIENSRRI